MKLEGLVTAGTFTLDVAYDGEPVAVLPAATAHVVGDWRRTHTPDTGPLLWLPAIFAPAGACVRMLHTFRHLWSPLRQHPKMFLGRARVFTSPQTPLHTPERSQIVSPLCTPNLLFLGRELHISVCVRTPRRCTTHWLAAITALLLALGPARLQASQKRARMMQATRVVSVPCHITLALVPALL